MASAPPSDENRRRAEQAAALAMLLAVPKARYSLPSLVRTQGIKPRPFRQIRPTLALKYDLSAPYYAIVRAWAAEQPALLAAYATGNTAAIQRVLDSAAIRTAPLVAQAQALFPRITQQIERWHRQQWVSRVRASTGLDVSMFTQSMDVADDTQATAVWNGQLAADVHRQVQHGIATALIGGGAAALPLSEVTARVREAVAKAKRRSAGIADDQVDKLSRAMDRSRREAAGVTTYRWHHTPQLHPRDWHRARDGKPFGPDDIEAGDRAGEPPFCKCWEEALL